MGRQTGCSVVATDSRLEIAHAQGSWEIGAAALMTIAQATTVLAQRAYRCLTSWLVRAPSFVEDVAARRRAGGKRPLRLALRLKEKENNCLFIVEPLANSQCHANVSRLQARAGDAGCPF